LSFELLILNISNRKLSLPKNMKKRIQRDTDEEDEEDAVQG
jgi:hypothetical protein